MRFLAVSTLRFMAPPHRLKNLVFWSVFSQFLNFFSINSSPNWAKKLKFTTFQLYWNSSQPQIVFYDRLSEAKDASCGLLLVYESGMLYRFSVVLNVAFDGLWIMQFKITFYPYRWLRNSIGKENQVQKATLYCDDFSLSFTRYQGTYVNIF